MCQSPSSVWGTIGILEFSQHRKEACPEFVCIDEALTYEALRGTTIKEGKKFGHFQSSVKRNWDSHGIQSR